MNHLGYKLFLFLFFVKLLTGFSQDFKVYNFDEFEPFLKKTDQKIYVINFWATWCKPCIKEIPAFNQLYEKYSGSNVEIVMVSLDFGKDVQSRLQVFKKNHDVKPLIIILDDPDSNRWIDKVSKIWSGAIPATLIYNSERQMFYEQQFEFEDLENELVKFLNSFTKVAPYGS